MTPATIDGFRFLDPATKRVMRAWHARDGQPVSIPWTPLAKPLDRARVALISSAGIALAGDTPFDQERERADPFWGDPSHRVIPRGTSGDDVRLYHLHVDTRPAAEDLDSVLPLRRLDELVDAGAVGSSAEDHYSIMGYILDTRRLVADTAPRIAEALVRQEVDLALLVPV